MKERKKKGIYILTCVDNITDTLCAMVQEAVVGEIPYRLIKFLHCMAKNWHYIYGGSERNN